MHVHLIFDQYKTHFVTATVLQERQQNGYTLLNTAAEYRLEGSVFEPRPDNLWMVSSSLWAHYRRLQPCWLVHYGKH